MTCLFSIALLGMGEILSGTVPNASDRNNDNWQRFVALFQ